MTLEMAPVVALKRWAQFSSRGAKIWSIVAQSTFVCCCLNIWKTCCVHGKRPFSCFSKPHFCVSDKSGIYNKNKQRRKNVYSSKFFHKGLLLPPTYARNGIIIQNTTQQRNFCVTFGLLINSPKDENTSSVKVQTQKTFLSFDVFYFVCNRNPEISSA